MFKLKFKHYIINTFKEFRVVTWSRKVRKSGKVRKKGQNLGKNGGL